MIITGTLTLFTAVAYWFVPTRNHKVNAISRTNVRFLFPDSPTNAWFLTMDERAKAVERIKVGMNGFDRDHRLIRVALPIG